MWALPVYAIASEGYDVSAVSVAQLRHRLDDRDHFTMWLFGCLERIGHAVTPPMRPTALRGLAADVEAAEILLRAHTAVVDPAADDPVVNRWTLATAITAGSAETSDGTTVDFPPDCELWLHRLRTIKQLDAVLVMERGGWPATTRVRTQGVPHYISPTGLLAAEAGVAPDRAVVASPAWDFNHEQGTLVDGPATHYYIQFRHQVSGVPTGEGFGPIPATNLIIDLDPFPDTDATTIAALGAGRRPGHATPVTQLPGSASDTVVSGGGHDPTGIPVMDPDIGVLPRSMAATDDLMRARAIQRVWELRDTELRHAGDSRPHRVAQRIAHGELPPPPKSLSSRDLALAERTNRQYLPPRLAPWCEPDRHLVTGRPREELIRWLSVMDQCTPRQRKALDGLDRKSTIDDVRAFLAAEGFVDVLEVPTGTDHVDLILVNADAGWLAIVHARKESDQVLQPQAVRVYYNVAVLDDELLPVYRGGYLVDENGLRTNIFRGHAYSALCYDQAEQSLRLHLAVLRAIGRPVTPWMASPNVHIGPDGTPRAERRRVLGLLPQSVHELFGPLLMPKDHNPARGTF